jgi:hypothetical protein
MNAFVHPMVIFYCFESLVILRDAEYPFGTDLSQPWIIGTSKPQNGKHTRKQCAEKRKLVGDISAPREERI